MRTILTIDIQLSNPRCPGLFGTHPLLKRAFGNKQRRFTIKRYAMSCRQQAHSISVVAFNGGKQLR